MSWRESRIAVTGLGLIGPLGTTPGENWENLVAGKSGISDLDKSLLLGKCDAKYFGYIGDKSRPVWERVDPHSSLSKREYSSLGEFVVLSYAAAKQAMDDSGLVISEEMEERAGVVVGTGVGGVIELERAVLGFMKTPRLNPFTVPASLASSPAGFLSAKFRCRAFNTTVITACSSGASAIVDSVNHIRMGDADVILTGGVEFVEIAVSLGGFHSMSALARKHDAKTASRPWDRDRDGFVMAEGAAMVVLEDMDHAQKRGAKIYAEIVGMGRSSDAYSMVAPDPKARGMVTAMKRAAEQAGISTDKIGYINAHGTSTPVGDRVEAMGVRKFMGEGSKINISATKSSTGHTLGAAGAVEAIFTIQALKEGIMPPTLNLHNPIEETSGMNLVPLEPQENKDMEFAMSNSFGFGGSNVCIVFKKV